jgi:hypothetical protein
MHERIVGLYEENAAAWDRQRGRDVRAQDRECGHATIWLAQMRPASGLDGSA